MLEEVQAKHPDVDVFAFADDGITLIEATSRPALVTKTKAVFDDLVVAFRKVNVELNTKTKVLCYHDAAVGLDAGASGVDILNVLGLPTSADHKAVAADPRLHSSASRIRSNSSRYCRNCRSATR